MSDVSASSREAMSVYAYAQSAPSSTAEFKTELADFCVDEDIGFELSGAGEHLCVRVRKSGVTTSIVARALASAAGVREADIGYAGMKDKQGICTQWFSIYLPSTREPDFSSLPGMGIEILQLCRNSRKIRRGSHRANIFQIRLRDIVSTRPQVSAKDDLETRLAYVADNGVPNYFGEQRFGIENNNVAMAERYFNGQLRLGRGLKRGVVLSSARSFIFNALLSDRVTEKCWNTYVTGDVMNLNGTDSVFVPDQWDAILQDRLQRFDIHPTGPLWGAGELRTTSAAKALEEKCSVRHKSLCVGLEKAGLQQSRRSLRLLVGSLQFQWLSNSDLELKFSLPPGAYATSVLREICGLRADKNEAIASE